jgi:predicted N-acyltransferase
VLQTARALSSSAPVTQTESDCTIPFPGGVAHVVARQGLSSRRVEWAAAFASKAKDHRYYEIIDESLDCGFEHYYLVLTDDAGVVRGIQPVFFVRQNLVEGVPAVRAAVDAIRRAFPRALTMQILMVGCAAGDAHLGACAADDEQWVVRALHATLPTFARTRKASLIVFKDFPARDRAILQEVLANEFTRVPSMPMTSLALRHRDFDGYLSSLGNATRKDLRRKFRRIEKAAPIGLEVTADASPIVDEIYPLYLQVHERSPMKFERLTKDYFRSLGQRMPDRVRFFAWRQEGRIIAFSVALVHDGTIYDDYLGLDYRVALDLHLYFHTFRDIIRWSLAHGLRRYCSSPLNYQPKLHLGCELMPLDLYVMHRSPLLNRLFRPALKFLEPTRHDPVLRLFPNANEL